MSAKILEEQSLDLVMFEVVEDLLEDLTKK